MFNFTSFDYIVVRNKDGIREVIIVGANAPFDAIPQYIGGLRVAGIREGVCDTRLIPKGVRVI
jgi:hypothetical protein